MDRYSAIERQNAAAIRRHADAASAESSAESHPLLQLQRQVGNAQIARLLAQRAAPEEDELQMARLQREGDDEELQMARLQREGDDEELQMARLQRAAPEEEDELQMSRLQREGDDEELQMARLQREGDDEELQMSRLQREGDDEELQMSRDLAQREPEVGLEGGPISSGLSERINAQRGGGAPLDDGVRGTMEGSLGASFEDVRVHSGGEAAALNRSIAGRAFTTGNDIFLGDSASPADSQLMAHELTHVVQQRSMSGGGPMTVSAAGDAHEQEAESVAAAVGSGAAPAAAAQRRVDDQG